MSHSADPPGAPWRDWRQALLAQWFRPRPGWMATLLWPLAWLYRLAVAHARRTRAQQAQQRPQPQRPVLVIGNLIVGGAGKTPTTIAIVLALRAAGRRPGVVSRGHGGRSVGVTAVNSRSDAGVVGDEPLLIHRRTGAPVVVGRDRVAAALQLLALHPEADVIVADDGLQHRQLRRDLEVVVFDERGMGNGLLLPAGPLREPFTPVPGPQMLVLYNHSRPSTPWPGLCAQRRLSGAWPLAEWLTGPGRAPRPLQTLQGRPLLAMAGIAVPERFFAALEAAGLNIRRLALPDHHAYAHAPWPADALEVITTEKDAVKLAAWAGSAPPIWVVGLDLELPAAFVTALLSRLPTALPPVPPHEP